MIICLILPRKLYLKSGNWNTPYKYFCLQCGGSVGSTVVVGTVVGGLVGGAVVGGKVVVVATEKQ